ncbi:hypothetical protein CapIbe_019895 [Capra ibex]
MEPPAGAAQQTPLPKRVPLSSPPPGPAPRSRGVSQPSPSACIRIRALTCPPPSALAISQPGQSSAGRAESEHRDKTPVGT